jgi:Uncharacterised protein conserved in bacteria (DUF2336)
MSCDRFTAFVDRDITTRNSMSASQQTLSDIARTADLKVDAEGGAVLQGLTAHFFRVAESLNLHEIELFDIALLAIAREGTSESRAWLSESLADNPLAPRRSVYDLACDDAIAVAGPVLRRSPCLNDETLVEIAALKGQDHLMAIADRASLAPPVTDVVAGRGEAPVLSKLLGNQGAHFSEAGAIRLCTRALSDPALLAHIRRRNDLRHALAEADARHTATRNQRELPSDVGAAVEAALEQDALDEALRLISEGARVQHRLAARCFATDPLETFVVLSRAANIKRDDLRTMLVQRLGLLASEHTLATAENLFLGLTRAHALRTAHILMLRDRALYN